jgi:hypothetical protein
MQHDRPQILRERFDAISYVWRHLVRYRRVQGEYFTLNRALLEDTVRHYVDELHILKIRCRIEDLAQSQKLAGLVAGSILKFRPVVPIDGVRNDGYIRKDKSNELLAIFHGVMVCADHYVRNYGASYDSISAFLKTARCEDWVNKYVYLLKERNYTPEALIMAFEGFCLANFPEEIEKELKDLRGKQH